MPIYTRTGDRGKTSLFSGKRVYKNDPRVETYGTIDELNSVIGIAIAHIKAKNKRKGGAILKKALLEVQSDLFYIGAYLADLPDSVNDVDLTVRIEEMEKIIDKFLSVLPPITNFMLPGGTALASFLHQGRAVARRSERLLVRMAKKEKVDDRVRRYVNRLSDLLYAAARYANYLEKHKEIVWER